MLRFILEFLASLLDVSIYAIYLHVLLGSKKKKISLPAFFLGFILMETGSFFISIFNYNTHSITKAVLTLVYNLAASFALTFYFHADTRRRAFASVSYLVYCCIGEFGAHFLLQVLFNGTDKFFLAENDTYVAFFSKFIYLFFVSITCMFWKKKRYSASLHYHLLTAFMPILLLVVAVNLSYQDANTTVSGIFSLVSLICLIVLDIIIFYLLDAMLQIQDLKGRENSLNQQITLQRQKYQQISATYRTTRSILHDTKKHFFYIQEQLRAHEYDRLDQYLTTSIKNLEAAYSRINTGNLVIDAFLSNHLTIAEQEHIAFHTRLELVCERIPVHDYDLCIILGNLLDNSMQECRKIPFPYPRKIKVELFTNQYEFCIHIHNTAYPTIPRSTPATPEDALLHGFGLQNVKNIVEKYCGSFVYTETPDAFDAIAVIPIGIPVKPVKTF